MKLDIFVSEKSDRYFWAKYFLFAKTTVRDAAYEIAVGQSIGNPNARNKWETATLVHDHSAVILETSELDAPHGYAWVGFPYANIDFVRDGISQLLCMLMGGQLDIDNILKCHLVDLQIDETQFGFVPCYGITGFRETVGQHNKPLFGGMIANRTF